MLLERELAVGIVKLIKKGCYTICVAADFFVRNRKNRGKFPEKKKKIH